MPSDQSSNHGVIEEKVRELAKQLLHADSVDEKARELAKQHIPELDKLKKWRREKRRPIGRDW